MLIIGEKINTVRKRVLRAYGRKDGEYIRQLAIRQARAGADVIDVNAGMDIALEPASMAWAVRIVQDAVDIPLCIDSSSPETIRAGFDACRNKRNAWANSISLEKARLDGILPLVKEHGCPVIGLCMGPEGIPATADGRVEAAKRLADIVDGYGIPLDRLYLDALIEPICVGPGGGTICLQTLRGIRSAFPQARTVICLSAVSFGLPERSLLNRVYLSLLMYEGIDAVILDPADRQLMMELRAAEALLGRDEYCMKYIAACRKGAVEERAE